MTPFLLYWSMLNHSPTPTGLRNTFGELLAIKKIKQGKRIGVMKEGAATLLFINFFWGGRAEMVVEIFELRPELEQETKICIKSTQSRGNNSCKTQGWNELVVLQKGTARSKGMERTREKVV